MLRKSAVIAVLIGFVCVVFGASCQTSSPPTPTSTISPVPSPTVLILTNTPTSSPTIVPSKTPIPPSCSWIPYSDGLDDMPTPSLSDRNCLNGLNGINVSGDAKKISFFAHLSPSLGTYGVCQDISAKDDLKFKIAIRDNIVSARFFVMIGPDPDPTKESSLGFRIQPEIPQRGEKEMWVKIIRYVLNDNGIDRTVVEGGGMQVPSYMKLNGFWNFDFVFRFSGSEVNMFLNKSVLYEKRPFNSSSRYLCFAYQQTPTTALAAELEAQANFP